MKKMQRNEEQRKIRTRERKKKDLDNRTSQNSVVKEKKDQEQTDVRRKKLPSK